MTKKLVSCILTICMLLTMLPTMAWANDAVVCTHVHDTAICGYVEAVAAVECTVEGCEHNGAEGCGYVAAIEGVACNHVCDACKPAGEPEPEQQPVLMMSPAPVAEFDGTLDIDNGSIVIEADGYTQGENAKVDYAGDYVITGTATTANTITVEGIATGKAITFSGLNNSNSSATYVLTVNSDATIKLVGENKLKSSGNAILIKSGATLTVEDGGSGSLAVQAANNKTFVAGGGLFKLESGNFKASGGSSGTAVTANVEINGGVFDVSYTGNSGAKGVNNSSFKLTGGEVYVTAKRSGINTGNFEMSGGSISKITVDGGKPAISATTVSITGGNVNGYFTDPIIDGYKLTKLHVVDANGEYQKKASMPITTSSRTWDTVTDGNGVITTYLADGESVTGGQEVADGVWLVGGTCICKTSDLSFANTVTEKDVYSNETVVDVVVGGECKMPVHEAVTDDVAVDSVTLEGSDTPVANPDTYATYTDGKLTLKPAGNTNNYTVKLSAKRGESATVYHEIKAWASNTVGRKFDIAKGPITVVGVAETDNVTYKQGNDEYTVSKNTQVTITGEAAANSANLIKVDNCDPSIILHNVTVTPASSSKSPILISGDSHAKIYISGTSELIKHISGKAPTRNICGIELSSSDAEKPAKVTIDCMEGNDCNDKDCPHKLYVYADLGAGIGAGQNASSFFEVNIEGGHIIAHPGNYGTGIGSGWNSTAQFTVNIKDGFVEADGGDFAALIGYGRNGTSENVEVNISGGIVEATSTFAGSGQAAIQAGVINISGTETVVDVIGGVTATKAMFISGGAAVSVAEKTVPDGATEGTAGFVSGTVIVEASASYEASVKQENSTIIVPTGKMESIVIGNDGTMTLPTGSVVETPDGATITAPAGENLTLIPDGTVSAPIGSAVTVTDKDGNVTTITPAEGEKVVVNPDGTMVLPEGTVIESADGTITTLPDGGSVAADGTITADGTVTITKGDEETTITPPAGEDVTVNPDGTVEVPAGSTVNGTVLPGTGDVILPADKVDEVKPGTTEGTVVLPEGTVIENADGSTTTLPDGGTVDANGKITSDGAMITEKTDGSVTVTEGDAVTIITPPTGEDVTVNPDGTVEVPAGSEIQIGDGEPTTIPEDAGTVILPADKVDEVKPGTTEGTVVLPEGTVIENADGTTTTLPDGGTVDANGTVTSDGAVITEKTDGTVTVTEGDAVTTITPPAGEDVTVNPDGTVEVPAGSEIQTGDGEPTTIPEDAGTVILPADKVDEVKPGTTEGTVVLPEGTVIENADGSTTTLPNGGTVDKNGTVTETPTVTPTPRPPYSGGYYPSYTPTVTPSVDSSSLNNAAQAVGNAINNGSAELKPATGYTKEDIAKLQKEGKLNLVIEKKSGYASVADKNLIDAAIKKAGGAVSGTSVLYFDITPVLKTDDGRVVATVTDTEKPLTITLDLSADLQKAAKDGKHIAVVRCHDGKATFIDGKLNAAKTKITFSSADFSTYAVVALEKQTSAQTFDAGIVVYAGMAVLAATGSAVVIGKKRK